MAEAAGVSPAASLFLLTRLPEWREISGKTHGSIAPGSFWETEYVPISKRQLKLQRPVE
ncbi:MAG: hypothetical protein HY648_01750 [Acidobacteria bacterium]|nr:hypothetical protein [Acidobacteriota bacterium]